MAREIDITPTWEEWARIYVQLVKSNEQKALESLHPELVRVARAADALNAILHTLTPEQHSAVAVVLANGRR